MNELPPNYRNMIERQSADWRLVMDTSRYDKHHARYHEAQRGPHDTAAKILARAIGEKSVRCPCGAEFPSGA